MTPGRAHERRASPRSRGTLALSLALSLTTGAGGCSFQWMKPAPPRADWPDPVVPGSSEQKCTDVIGLPIADTIAGGALGTIAFIERNAFTGTYVLKDPAGQLQVGAQTTVVQERLIGGRVPSRNELVSTPDEVSRSIALGLGVAAIAFLASAVYGYVQTARCRHYKSIF